MARPALWTTIHDRLSSEIAAGHYAPGDRLPTEAELSARFGVNRHTVRRAVQALADTGTVIARRGAGVFVQHKPTHYPIGKRVRFHRSLQAAGHVPEKRVLMLTTRPADAREARALALSEGELVHLYEGLSLSDSAPIAFFRSAFPAARFPGLLDALRADPSVTAGFAAHDLADYTRAWTEVTAKSADPALAGHLSIPPGAPVLRSVGVNIDAEGIPVEYGRTYFAGDRVTLNFGGDDPADLRRPDQPENPEGRSRD